MTLTLRPPSRPDHRQQGLFGVRHGPLSPMMLRTRIQLPSLLFISRLTLRLFNHHRPLLSLFRKIPPQGALGLQGAHHVVHVAAAVRGSALLSRRPSWLPDGSAA